MKNVEGRVAVVAGAGSGIDRLMTESFGRPPGPGGTTDRGSSAIAS
jgi:NADP-dependent 3-hydroxy acid dehydrogenase YdfG